VTRLATDDSVPSTPNWRAWTYWVTPVAAALLLAATLFHSTDPPGGMDALGPVVEQWTVGELAQDLPVTALFWQPEVPEDSLLHAVLVANPEGALDEYEEDYDR